jgi:hypothetical protein
MIAAAVLFGGPAASDAQPSPLITKETHNLSVLPEARALQEPMGLTDDEPSFLQRIIGQDAARLVQLFTDVGGVGQLFGTIINLFRPSDTDRILQAINDLRQDLDRDFRQLGDLIQQQTQIVVDTVNRDAMALALSRSDVAMDRIQEFIINGNLAALETAKSESIAGARFFTELGVSSPDLSYFLPGIVKATVIRVFVIGAEPMDLHEPDQVISDDMQAISSSLAVMADQMRQKVDSAHVIAQVSHVVQCWGPPPPEPNPQETPTGGGSTHPVTVIDGFTHEEGGVRLQFFDAQRDTAPCDQPSPYIDDAYQAARNARDSGVHDELAFLGYWTALEILDSVRRLLN